jgi:hypothetical protein
MFQGFRVGGNLQAEGRGRWAPGGPRPWDSSCGLQLVSVMSACTCWLSEKTTIRHLHIGSEKSSYYACSSWFLGEVTVRLCM